jgi:Protein of unknown function (DUF3253)
MDPDRIREEIRARVHARADSICPSEVARGLAEDWRPLMPAVREQAGALADAGELRVTQRERDVDPRTARGPIRLRRAPPPPG